MLPFALPFLLACTTPDDAPGAPMSAGYLGDYVCEDAATDDLQVYDVPDVAALLVYRCTDYNGNPDFKACAPATYVQSATSVQLDCEPGVWYEVWALTPPA